MRAATFFETSEGQKYLEKFRGEIFVVKYGGAALERESMMDYFLEDIAGMAKRGIRIILVHGGGKFLSAKMKEKNIPVEFENGMRKTTPEVVEIAAEAFAELNARICERLKAFGVAAEGFTHGRLVDAKLHDPSRPENRIGDIVRIHPEVVSPGVLPVISSIGLSVGPPEDVLDQGSLLNINADLMAVRTAVAFHARKTVFISDVNGIYRDINNPASIISHATETEIQSLIEQGILAGGMRLKVEMALEALRGGVKKVHFIDGGLEHSIIREIFTDKGIGTEIVHDE